MKGERFIDYDVPPVALLEADYSKLETILPVVTKENQEEWIAKSKSLSRSDLNIEVREAQGKPEIERPADSLPLAHYLDLCLNAENKELVVESRTGEKFNIVWLNIDKKAVELADKAVEKLGSNSINDLIKLFEPINPSYERLFPMTSQREALERMVKKHGIEKVKEVITALPGIVGKPYAPRVTTPIQLENKLGELVIFVKQNGHNKYQAVEYKEGVDDLQD